MGFGVPKVLYDTVHWTLIDTDIQVFFEKGYYKADMNLLNTGFSCSKITAAGPAARPSS